jgi:curved DNA-binding protein
LHRAAINHYATLGLDRRCPPAQIRAAYRALARQHHPDLNPNSPAAVARTQELNAAHEILNDPELRAAYDRELETAETISKPSRPPAKKAGNVTQEIFLRLEEFLRGANLEVRVNDPGNPAGAEMYPLAVPPETAPGTRFRISRTGFFAGSFILVRVKARPDFRFKVRGSDLRCDLKITFQRALTGGVESVRGVAGNYLRVTVPKKVPRGEVLSIANEGLPKARSGRGDLLVRIVYSPAVQIRRR